MSAAAVLKHADDDARRALAVASQPPPTPLPLPAELPPVAAFPMDTLPDSFKGWVADVTERMRCPPEFVGVPMLVGASMLIARTVSVQPQARSDWTERPNLWGALVAPPGWMKSPAMKAALAPIERMEARAAAKHGAAMEGFKVNLLAHKLSAEVGEKLAKAALAKDRGADVRHHLTGDEPKAPTWPRYTVNDTSYEKLHSLFEENPGGLLSVRDELRGLLIDLAKEEKSEARAMYLQSWSGGAATLDRIGRGTVRVPDACLSMIGGIQPGPLTAMLSKSRGGAGDDGMLERFLIAWPDSPGAWRNVDQWPDSAAKRAAWEVFDRLDKFNAAHNGAHQDRGVDGQPCGPWLLRLADDAREHFEHWRAEFMQKVRRIGEENERLSSALMKFNHHVPALALVLHVTEGGSGPVSKLATLRALELADYFESHATRLHSCGRTSILRAARLILAKIKAKALAAEFTARDIYARDWSGLNDSATVKAALDVLSTLSWLHETAISAGGEGGRPSTLYTLTEGARRG